MADDGTGSMVIRLFRFLCGGLSQRAWAKLVGVQRRQVQAWENGRTVPRRSTLEHLATRSSLVLAEVEPLVPALLRLERMREGRVTASTGPGSAMEALDILLGEAVDLELPRLLTELPSLSSGPPAGQGRTEADRAAAEILVDILGASHNEEEELLISKGRSFRSWAVVERLCAKSVEAAADDPNDALRFASLACSIAGQVDGDPALRSECQGYAWAFFANTRRVANDLEGSEKAFAQAHVYWPPSLGTASDLLDKSRLFDLEASLRREQGRMTQALDLLEQALSACRTASGENRVLLNRSFTQQQMGDSLGALDSLARAAQQSVGQKEDLRLAFGIHFNLATVFCDLHRFQEADRQLPAVRERAERLDNGLDLVRVEWLEAKVAAGLGREEEAEAGLQRVRKQFEDRPLPADAALAALELARLYLRQGRTAETRELAAEAAPVLDHLGVEHQARQAVALFWQAARTEAATLELVERAIDALRRARPARS